MNSKTIFQRDRDFPYAEIRKTSNSSGIYKPHSHDKLFSIGAMTNGEAVMQTPSGSHTVRAGVLTFFNPLEVHSCNPSSGKARSYIMMHLDLQWCTDVQAEAGITEQGFVPLEISVASDRELYDEFIAICEEESLDRGRLKNFLIEIFDRYCELPSEKMLPTLLMEEVESYIRENRFENISLDGVAEKFRQNSFHLLRSFKKIYGQPPIAYQMNLRIESAKKMLRDGVSIADTAQKTGFQDQSHFHRVFKKLTAVTPGQYQTKD